MKLRYFSRDPGKREGEIFFLRWSVVWMAFFGGIVVTRIYETFTAWHYLGVGLLLSVLPIGIPLLFPVGPVEGSLHWTQRYTTKANLWIFILSFIGNYLWTHYFYNVLGAGYSMPRHDLNEVPFALYLITHSYFLTYHTLATIGLRIVEQWTSTSRLRRIRRDSSMVASPGTPGGRGGTGVYDNDKASKFQEAGQHGIIRLEQRATGVLCFWTRWCVIIGSSLLMAFLEAFTLENYPYYFMKDRSAFYKYGTIFYALYFIVSFPMFRRVDERYSGSNRNWSLGRTALDSFACCMIVTMLLDFWRLFLGPIV